MAAENKSPGYRNVLERGRPYECEFEITDCFSPRNLIMMMPITETIRCEDIG
jgi:hypothetical protein